MEIDDRPPLNIYLIIEKVKDFITLPKRNFCILSKTKNFIKRILILNK